MSLFITSLNSGSNGNCYYIGNEREAIFVDAGISCRETETRMARLGLSIRKVKAIFVSHEHTDHIRGITVLAKKYQIPVYITPLTLQHAGLFLDDHLIKTFFVNNTITIGDLEITAFTKLHDAAEPHSFVITCGDTTVGVFTDIGAVCQNLISNFKKCTAAFLETNYDEDLLENGNYPFHLKRRIRGGMGHLSNKEALKLFTDHKLACMTHLFLSHLSKDNNCPKLVHNLFHDHAHETAIIVASRFEETPVHYITSQPGSNRNTTIGSAQFSLF